ncbi:hypothetical protein DFA_00821 [Cavenderia fasciculata]|uniref:Adenylate kinase isoenzyme 6 homolog n=1 Tax=Cavenderia fasciculata TaxID=261658 RepID=F4PU26_CACFS|nr:uncharacterized protein DFA_00821 [Cavenderia fasciculata]EGG20952.1 hypothetical protein DFA_00821 [Cavenderia fasciculata]|eukprot:XP_004358802.1 hypothetical protein DFA_00821 [Cavenderia fasciculata]
MSTRRNPNILITGTPGTGKTTLAESIAQTFGYKHIDVSSLVKEKDLHDGFDEEFQCWVLDEDKVCDEMEDQMTNGGVVVDHHSCEWFPERWFDLVIVLRTDTKELTDRMIKRKYNQLKIDNNIDCEIMQLILQEAFSSYKEEIIMELQSSTIEDNENNQQIISDWTKQFVQSRQQQ